MRVVLDGTPLLIPITGIGIYTLKIIEELSVLPSEEMDITVSALSFRGSAKIKNNEYLKNLGGRIKIRGVKLPANIMYYRYWKYFSRPSAESFMGRFDIYHATNYNAPFLKKAKLVSTLHDLNFIRYPEMQEKGILRFSEGIRVLAEKSDIILADSNFSKNEIVKLLAIKEDKIEVVYPAFTEAKVDENCEIARDYLCQKGVKNSYIVFLGNLHPRKNLRKLIEAFKLLKDRGYEGSLVVMGGGGLGKQNEIEMSSLKERIQELSIHESVFFTGYVENNLKHSILKGSSLLCLPSLYEGFGIPPLEAMNLGVPTVVSRKASLEEVCSDASAYIENPKNQFEIADQIERVLSREDIREELIKRGRERASGFTWKNTANGVLKAYRRVLN